MNLRSRCCRRSFKKKKVGSAFPPIPYSVATSLLNINTTSHSQFMDIGTLLGFLTLDLPSHLTHQMLGVIKTVWSQTIFLCLSHTLFFVEQMCHCFTYNRFSYGFLQSHYYRRPYFFWSSVVIPCYNITNAIIVIILLNCLHIKKNRSSPQQANTHLQ